VLLGDGTQVRRGSRISRSVLGVRSMVGKNCVIEDSVLLGADYYETKRDQELFGAGVAMGVGDGCRIRKAIIDKNARVGEGCVLVNKAGLREGGDEKRGWVVVDGITVVLKNATLQPGTVV
jgi:glucose-1-phosphate adenylyltransferase